MKKISGYLIGVTLIIALLTLAGWQFDIEFLKLPFDSNEIMGPMTALSMVVASVSFYLQCKMKPGPKTLVIAKLLAFSVLGVALIKLLALTGIDLDIDHWLYKDKMLAGPEIETRSAKLSVINSAIGFFITGTALLLIGLKGKWPGRAISFLGLTGFVIGTFVCLGFIYHINEFYGWLPYMAVAPATGICFVVFSLGILFENNQAGFMEVLSSHYLGGKIARGLIPIGIGVPIVFGYIGLALSWWFPFSAALGTALLNLSIIIVFLIVLWFLARALNALDMKREQVEILLEQQAQLFNIIPDAVIYGNTDFILTNLNPAARQLFNVRKEEIGHIKTEDLYDLDITSSNRGEIRRELMQNGYLRTELIMTTRTGKKIHAMLLAKTVENENGIKTGWIAIYTDISFLRVNEELQIANDYLEQLAFISAHDIKSPILTLQGLTDLQAQSENLKPEDLHVLELQKNVIKQMQATNKALNEILMLRKKLKAKGKSGNEALPLREIINNVTGILETEFNLAGARLETDITEVSEIKLHHVYFQSLFYNLISNSFKYRDAGRPLLIKVTGAMFGGGVIKFSVEDNGIGFDMQHNKKRLFGIFKRFHNHVEGTGVGLHIVKSIVDAFNGTIEVESEPGKGTRFEITFRMASLH